MNIREINKPITAATLNESLAKRFGQKVALDKFTTEQLQDVRNKVRTTLSQVETNESFDTVQSEAFQKNKLFLDVLNAEISERADIQEKKKPDADGDGVPDWADKKPGKDDNEAQEGYRVVGPAVSGGQFKSRIYKSKEEAEKRLLVLTKATDLRGKRVYKSLDVVKEAVELEEVFSQAQMKKAIGIARKSTGNYDKAYAEIEKIKKGLGDEHSVANALKKANESVEGAKKGQVPPQFKKKNESIVKEGAEDNAEIIMAAKDMVNRVTSWMEDTAEMQTESMLELADAIRDEKGQQESDSFVNTVKPSLESLYSALESTRESLTQGVGQLTGEAEPVDDLGAEPDDMDMEPTVDAEAEPDLDVSLDAADASAGGEEEAGREKRESIQRKREMIESSRRLGTILSKKK